MIAALLRSWDFPILFWICPSTMELELFESIQNLIGIQLYKVESSDIISLYT